MESLLGAALGVRGDGGEIGRGSRLGLLLGCLGLLIGVHVLLEGLSDFGEVFLGVVLGVGSLYLAFG